MKENLTEMVFILDRSGSMGGLEADTIGGFNSMIERQKKEEGECLVSVVLFDHYIDVLYDRIPLADMPVMTEKEYFTRGSTALLDALGGAIHHIGNVHKYAREEDRPAKTVFVITTDGMENSSIHYKARKVKEMVKHEQEKYGWEFLFLGANIDAIEVANAYGLKKGRAVRYHNDKEGIGLNYSVLSETIATFREKGFVEENWEEKIRKDYVDRKKESENK